MHSSPVRQLTALVSVLLATAGLAMTPAWASASASPSLSFHSLELPSTLEPNGSFAAVDCTSSAWCMAVGEGIREPGIDQPTAFTRDAATWSNTTPLPARDALSSTFDDVACASRNSCIAVGSATARSLDERPLAERWNGDAWHRVTPADGLPYRPRHHLGSYLHAVSCAAASDCVAVGAGWNDGVTAGSAHALLLQWNGRRWHRALVPVPHGRKAVLTDVSCVAGGACTAVGVLAGRNQPLFVERRPSAHAGWQGRLLPTPYPTKDHGPNSPNRGVAPSVSCTTATSCVVVGSYLAVRPAPRGSGRAFSEVWDGRSWRIVAMRNPDTFDFIQTVACATPRRCVATGDTEDRNLQHNHGLTERWNGSRWTRIAAPALAAPELTRIGLSCVAHRCFAAGSPPRANAPAVQRLGPGGQWAAESIGNYPAPPFGELDGVSCTSSVCAAVGQVGAGTTVERTEPDGGWTSAVAPEPAKGVAYYNRVSCVDGGFCMAIGRQLFPPHNAHVNGLAETRQPDGTWQLVHGTDWHERDVSCASSAFCVAVGGHFAVVEMPNDLDTPLRQVWNGTQWSDVDATMPAGAKSGTLTAVSCPSTAFCLATGAWTTAANHVAAFTETWNGSAWTIDSAPAGLSPDVSALSCTSSTSCVAVGPEGPDHSPQSQVWDGAAWTTEPVATAGVLDAISCVSATDCTAVGVLPGPDFGEDGGPLPTGKALLARWDGTTWSTSVVPHPTRYLDVELTGVSCTAGDACTAVGYANGYTFGVPIGGTIG